MKSINHIELPFNLPYIGTSESENEKVLTSSDLTTLNKNKKCENYFLYPHKKENMYEQQQNISIFQQKTNHYLYIKAEERLNSFIRRKLQINIDRQKRLHSEFDENYQFPTRHQSTEQNISIINPFQEYKLKVSLPHLMPVIKQKQTLSPNRKSSSPNYETDFKKHFNPQNEQIEKKQYSPCSIVHLNNNLRLPTEIQKKKLFVNLNLERLMKIRAKKNIIQDLIINNTIQEITQPIQVPKEEELIQRLEFSKRHRYPKRIIVDKQSIEKCGIKKRVTYAQTELDQVSQIYDFKPQKKILKTQNTNKLAEFNHKLQISHILFSRLQTMAFQGFQEWQTVDEDFDPVGDYVINKLKRNQER